MVKQKKTTDQKIDDLALAVKRGFDGVDEKFKGIDEKFKSLDQQFKTVFDQLRILGSDMHDVKITLASLLKMVAERDREINSIDLRLRRVEQHLGLLAVT